MSTSIAERLPEYILSIILCQLKPHQKLSPLRLVCRHFNYVVSEHIFRNLSLLTCYGEDSNDPVTWITNGNQHLPMPSQCERLIHQIDTLYYVIAPAALRRIKHLKLYVSTLFKAFLDTDTWDEWGQLVVKTMVRVMFQLPAVIRTLEGLESAEIYFEGSEPGIFYDNLSKALEECPQLHTLDFKFLSNTRILEHFPIINSQRLDTIKLSWPLSPAEEAINPSHPGSPCIYSKILCDDSIQNLRRLELWSKIGARSYDFGSQVWLKAFSQLEELTIINMPLIFYGLNDIADMPNLTSLRLEGFRNTSITRYHDPYQEMWGALKTVKRSLKIIQIDYVSPNLVSYLNSYTSLQALVLTLGRNPDFTLIEAFFKYGVSAHKESLKIMHIDICPQTAPGNRWYYEYWHKYLYLPNLRILKMTTVLNIALSRTDMVEFKKHLLGIAITIPLRKLIVRYGYEKYAYKFEKELDECLTNDPLWTFTEPFPFAPHFQLCFRNLKRSYMVKTIHGAGFCGIISIVGVHE